MSDSTNTTTTGTGATVDGSAATDQQQDDAVQAAANADATDQQHDGPFDGPFDPERARRTIDTLREEVRQLKAARQAAPAVDQDALLAQLAQLVAQAGRPAADTAQQSTPESTPAPADVDTVHAELEQAREDARRARVELAAHQAATAAGVDSVALLDSRSFERDTAGLDPADPKFVEHIDAAITKAVEANPRLRVAQVPAASGSGTPGRPGEGPQARKPLNLTDAVASHYGT